MVSLITSYEINRLILTQRTTDTQRLPPFFSNHRHIPLKPKNSGGLPPFASEGSNSLGKREFSLPDNVFFGYHGVPQ